MNINDVKMFFCFLEVLAKSKNHTNECSMSVLEIVQAAEILSEIFDKFQ